MNKILEGTVIRATYMEVCHLAIQYSNHNYEVLEVTPTSITVNKDFPHFTERITIRCEG